MGGWNDTPKPQDPETRHRAFLLRNEVVEWYRQMGATYKQIGKRVRLTPKPRWRKSLTNATASRKPTKV